MLDSWAVVTVEEIKADSPNALSTGPFGSSISSRFFQSTGVPVLRGSNISEDVGRRLLNDDLTFVSQEKAREFHRSLVYPGDLVFTCWGTIGQVGLIEDDSPYAEYVISNKPMKLTPKCKRADSLFLYYLFSGPEMHNKIKSQSIGSSVPGFNLGQLRSLRLLLPPLHEQRAIASVLGALDDKIELNRRMNATLEAMARALFKSWFVDFDPVRAKMEGRTPYGMDANTADLFPATFEDSPIGPIPAGWSVEEMGRHVRVTKGLSYKGSGLSSSGIPLHNLNSIYEGGGYKHVGIKYYVGEYKERHILHPGDLVVANTEQGHKYLLIGCPALIPEQYGNSGIFTHHLFRVRPLPSSPLSSLYLYQLLRDGEFRSTVTGFTNGTTVNMLSADGLTTPQMVVPPLGIIQVFDAMIGPLLRKLDSQYEESVTLGNVRDTLLPKLLSGAVRVPDAVRGATAAV